MSNEDESKSIWSYLVSITRDALVFAAALSLIGTVTYNLTKPFWQPVVELIDSMPEELVNLRTSQEDLSESVEELSIQLRESLEPRIVEFDGPGITVIDEVQAGDIVPILYFLRRNASCETTVEPIWLNIDTNVSVTASEFTAQRAPVTEAFQPFTVSIPVPSFLSPGRYVYVPRIKPRDCGVYGEIRVPPTTIIEVVNETN